MWTYTFTYEIDGVETVWTVETEPKSTVELIELFDNNEDIPNGIQCKIDGVAI
jgi:hypothetical protein